MKIDPVRPQRGLRSDLTLTRAPDRRRRVSNRAIERRARAVLWAKRLLPAIALGLLSLIVLWPEFTRITEASRHAVSRFGGSASLNGQLMDAHYRGVDERGRNYTITASAGRQLTPDLIELTNPKADTTLESGGWLMVRADHGMYLQHRGELDLYGHVVLYRDDGIFLSTSTATMDLKTGFAAGQHVVSIEGPFGTLDAFGFAIADKGTIAQFTGPARLILNAVGQ